MFVHLLFSYVSIYVSFFLSIVFFMQVVRFFPITFVVRSTEERVGQTLYIYIYIYIIIYFMFIFSLTIFVLSQKNRGKTIWLKIRQLLLQSSPYIRPPHSLLEMPNGHQASYRVHPKYDPPSPLHSSDSEETWEQKHRYGILSRWTIKQWRRFVRRQKVRRIFMGHLPRLAISRVACYI